jgi:hypothetical protein
LQFDNDLDGLKIRRGCSIRSAGSSAVHIFMHTLHTITAGTAGLGDLKILGFLGCSSISIRFALILIKCCWLVALVAGNRRNDFA